MIRISTFVFVAWCALGIGSVGSIANAETTATEAELTLAKDKYRIAQMATKVNEKCSLLTDVAKKAALYSAKYYAEFLKANGESTYVSEMSRSIVPVVSNTSCTKMSRDPQMQQLLRSTTYLTGEYLLAFSKSGVETCGDINAQDIAMVMQQATLAAKNAAQRQDYLFIKLVAEERGEELAELCASPITSDPQMLIYTDIGSVFVSAINVARNSRMNK